MTYREYMDTPVHVLELYLSDVLDELAATRDGLGETPEPGQEPASTPGWMQLPT